MQRPFKNANESDVKETNQSPLPQLKSANNKIKIHLQQSKIKHTPHEDHVDKTDKRHTSQPVFNN